VCVCVVLCCVVCVCVHMRVCVCGWVGAYVHECVCVKCQQDLVKIYCNNLLVPARNVAGKCYLVLGLL